MACPTRIHILLLSLLLADAAAAMQVQHYQVDAGLPQNSATALALDRFGLLWVGTEDGLARFDGERFVAFPEAAARGALPGNYVVALAADHDAVWVAAESGGLARFDLLDERFDPVPVRNPLDQRQLNPWALLPHGDTLFVGTRDQGLLQLDRRTPTRVLGHWHRAADARHRLDLAWVRVIEPTRTGDALWLGGIGGLRRLQLGSGQVQHEPLPGIDLPADTLDVGGLVEDPDGSLWLATRSHGLFRRDSAAGAFRAIRQRDADAAPTSMADIARTHDGRVLVASDHGLLQYFPSCDCLDPPAAAGAQRRLLGDAFYLSVLADGDFVWAGTWNRGLLRLDARAASFDLLAAHEIGSELRPAQPRSLHVDRTGQLWIGTFGQGARHAPILDAPLSDWDWQSVSPPGDARSRQVWAFAETPAGETLIGTDAGILRWNQGIVGRIDLEPQQPDLLRTLLVDTAGDTWVGAVGGVYRLQGEALRRYGPAEGLDDLRVYALGEWPRGRILAGTWSGLFRLAADGARFERWNLRRDGADYPTRLVWDLHVDDDGTLWVGTSAGLLRLAANGGDEIERIAVAEGLPNPVVYAIEPEGREALWLSTNRGLARLELGSRQVTAYDARDGLQGDEFGFAQATHDARGRLYFGGLGGISRFDPGGLRGDPRRPRALLVGLSIGNRPLAVGESRHGRVLLHASLFDTRRVELDWRDADLGFAFSALSAEPPERLRFQYRLDGKDREWIDAGERRYVGYTNLAPGPYRFRLRAASRFGGFGDERLLELAIAPPLWATWPFRIGAAALLLLLAMAALRWRFAALNRSRAELAAEVARQTERIREQNDQLEAANQALYERSIRDPLTGAFNRRHLAELAEQAWRGCDARGEPFALVLFDLDHFKQVNDRHGHAAGDAVLCAVVQALKPVLRATEALGRFGGEEFLVLLPQHDAAAAVQRAEALRRLLHNLRVASGADELHISASFGVAAANRGREPSLDALLASADAALYRAKAAGRDRVEAALPTDAPAHDPGAAT